MPEFLFQIKGKLGEPETGFYGGSTNWSFPPIWQDKVEAKDKKEAKILIDEMYGKKFPLRVLEKDLASNEFLLNIKEIKADDNYTKELFENIECLQCKGNFKIIEKYQVGSKNASRVFCSDECKNEHSQQNKPATQLDYLEQNAIHQYVIYKITNKENNKCYVGQTKQAFTFRWYQHFYQSKEVKFHEAIKSFPVTAWTFEVIEVINVPEVIKHDKDAIRELVFKTETDYIKKYNSINNGYNSVKSMADLMIDANQIGMDFLKDELKEMSNE